MTSWETGAVSITTLSTPQWIPQMFWVIGLIMFVVTLAFVLVHALVAVACRNWQVAAKVAGIMTIEEEIVEETHGVEVVLGPGKGER